MLLTVECREANMTYQRILTYNLFGFIHVFCFTISFTVFYYSICRIIKIDLTSFFGAMIVKHPLP